MRPSAPGPLFPTRRALRSAGRAPAVLRAGSVLPGWGSVPGPRAPRGIRGDFGIPAPGSPAPNGPNPTAVRLSALPLCSRPPTAPLNGAMSRQARVAITPTTLRSLRSPGAWRRQTPPLSPGHAPNGEAPPSPALRLRPPRRAACGDWRRAAGPAPGRLRAVTSGALPAGGMNGRRAVLAAQLRRRARAGTGTARLGSARLGSAAGTGAVSGRGPARCFLPALFSPLRRPPANKMMQSSALAAEGAVKGLPEILGVPVQRKDAFLFSPRPLPAALCPSAALLLLSFLPVCGSATAWESREGPRRGGQSGRACARGCERCPRCCRVSRHAAPTRLSSLRTRIHRYVLQSYRWRGAVCPPRQGRARPDVCGDTVRARGGKGGLRAVPVGLRLYLFSLLAFMIRIHIVVIIDYCYYGSPSPPAPFVNGSGEAERPAVGGGGGPAVGRGGQCPIRTPSPMWGCLSASAHAGEQRSRCCSSRGFKHNKTVAK